MPRRSLTWTGHVARWLLLPVLPACPASRDCELPEIAAALAGASATDCGLVPVGGDASAADACAVEAFQAGAPFFVVYELQGMDSAVSTALAYDGADLVSLYRDSDPSGGSNVGAVVTEHVCTSGSVVPDDAGHDVVFCDAPACTCEEEACGSEGACCAP